MRVYEKWLLKAAKFSAVQLVSAGRHFPAPVCSYIQSALHLAFCPKSDRIVVTNAPARERHSASPGNQRLECGFDFHPRMPILSSHRLSDAILLHQSCLGKNTAIIQHLGAELPTPGRGQPGVCWGSGCFFSWETFSCGWQRTSFFMRCVWHAGAGFGDRAVPGGAG